MSVLCCCQSVCQCGSQSVGQCCDVFNLSVLKSICMSVLCCNLSVSQRYVVVNLHVSAVL